MPELEPFDARIEAAVHAFADRVQTSVDAAATAEYEGKTYYFCSQVCHDVFMTDPLAYAD